MSARATRGAKSSAISTSTARKSGHPELGPVLSGMLGTILPRKGLGRQPGPALAARQPRRDHRNAHELGPPALAASDLDLAPRHVEIFGEHAHELLVGLAVHRRRGDGHLELAFTLAEHAALGCSG